MYKIQKWRVHICSGCRTDKLDSTTCVIETYRECPDEVFANNNALVPGVTRTAIIFEQWGNFKDGAELCGKCKWYIL